jgi:hypothetical protein
LRVTSRGLGDVYKRQMQDVRFPDSRSLIFLLALVMVSRQNVAP